MSRSKIILDARKLGDGGIGTYIENLVDGLLELQISGQASLTLGLILHPAQSNDQRSQGALNRWGSSVQTYSDASDKYSLSEYFLMPRRLRSVLQGAAVYHSPHFTLPVGLDLPSVVTVHDVLHLTHGSSKTTAAIARVLIGSALRRADVILTVSNHSKRRIEQCFSSTPSSHIEVVHNAVSDPERWSHSSDADLFQNRPELVSDVLWVGNEKKHKQLDVFVDAIDLLRRRGEKVSALVIAPDLSTAMREKLRMSKVSFVSNLPARDLEYAYAHTRVVVLNSLDEGSGLSAAEALRRNKAVIATPLPSVEEVCLDAPFYTKDMSAVSLTETLEHVFSLSSEELMRRCELFAGKARELSPVEQARKVCRTYEIARLRWGHIQPILNESAQESTQEGQRSVG